MINFIKEYLRVALGLLAIALMAGVILLPGILRVTTGCDGWLLVYVALIPVFFMDPSL